MKIHLCFIFIIILISTSSCNPTEPNILTIRKQVPAETGVFFPAVGGYEHIDNDVLFWVCTEKEVNVWDHGNYVSIEYKKNGKTFASPQLFYYRLPKGCPVETILKIGSFEKDYLLSRVNELKKIDDKNKSSDNK